MSNNLPSVTTVLQPFSNFGGVSEARLAYAADRGTRVHKYCAAVARNLWLPWVDEDCRGYLQSFRRWFDTYVENVHMVEGELVHEVYGYKGHPDLIATLRPHLTVSLIDLKTPIGSIPRTWRGQLSAYAMAARLQGLDVRSCGPLQLDPQGGMARVKQWVAEHEIETEFSYFLAALTAYRYYSKEQ